MTFPAPSVEGLPTTANRRIANQPSRIAMPKPGKLRDMLLRSSIRLLRSA